MRINEMTQATEALFEETDTEKVLNVALSGDAVWSKPMSPEDTKASLLALINNDHSRPQM